MRYVGDIIIETKKRQHYQCQDCETSNFDDAVKEMRNELQITDKETNLTTDDTEMGTVKQ